MQLGQALQGVPVDRDGQGGRGAHGVVTVGAQLVADGRMDGAVGVRFLGSGVAAVGAAAATVAAPGVVGGAGPDGGGAPGGAGESSGGAEGSAAVGASGGAGCDRLLMPW